MQTYQPDSRLAAFSAQKKAPEGFTVIEEQPEGELRIYSRSGSIVKEIINDDDVYEIVTGTQDGTVNIVFAKDGSVYFQRPVSESYYEGWVKGTLSRDGRTITVPTGQYTAYTRSFDMAVQVWMMRYDEEQNTYVADQDITEIVYTIADDGTIALQGTDQQHVLGCVNRCFGESFSYLDFEWHNNGSDYESVYTPMDVTLVTPPEDLQTQELIATTGYFDGYEWKVYQDKMLLGFDGDVAWLQGFTNLLPKAWLKGKREGDTVTFPSGQLLGSYYSTLLYMVGAKFDNDEDPVISDLVFTYDGKGSYTSYTDAFVSSSKDDIVYMVYYMGMTLSDQPDQTVTAPDELLLDEYQLSYQEPDDNGRLIKKQSTVWIGRDEDTQTVYLQGITPLFPKALIAGTLHENGQVTFDSPQYMGSYYEEAEGNIPIFFQAFNGTTGTLLPQVTFNFNTDTQVFDTPSAAISIGINKTGLLSLQYIYNAVLMPADLASVKAQKIGTVMEKDIVYDLQGRRIKQPSSAQKGIYIRNGKKSIY